VYGRWGLGAIAALAAGLIGCASDGPAEEPDASDTADVDDTGASTGASEDEGQGEETGDTGGVGDSEDGDVSDDGSDDESDDGSDDGTDDGTEGTGGDALACDGIEQYVQTWAVGIGSDTALVGGAALAQGPDGTLWVEARVDEVQALYTLDAAGQPSAPWFPAVGNMAIYSRDAHQGLLAHPDGSLRAVGVDGGLWAGALDPENDSVTWSDSMAFPEWEDAVPADAAIGPGGSLYVMSQIERFPLERAIVLAKYSPDGELLWDGLVPDETVQTNNFMGKAVVARSDGEVIVVNRSAVVFHRFDADGNHLGDVNDVLYGTNGSPRYVGLDRQDRLVVGVAAPIGGGDDVAEFRRFDLELAAEWEVQLDDTGYSNELMAGLDADDAILDVHDWGEQTVLHKIVDGEIVLTQELEPTERTTTMTVVDDCSFVLTGQAQDEAGDWQYWRRRYDPA